MRNNFQRGEENYKQYFGGTENIKMEENLEA